MFLKRPVHIARGGTIIGEYSSADLQSLLEAGELKATDVCYLEDSNLWINLPDYIHSSSLPKFQPPLKPLAEARGGSAPQWDAAPQNPIAPLLGWVAFIIAFAMLLGAGTWIYILNGEVKKAQRTATQMQQQMLDQDRQYREIVAKPVNPSDRMRVLGTVKLNSEDGDPMVMPAFSVHLYKRQTVEDYLRSKSLDLAAMKPQLTSEKLSTFLTNMPPPLKKAITDSLGNYEFDLPAEGKYVIFSSMTLPGGGNDRIFVWFLGFSTDDPLNLPVHVTDMNRSGQFVPELMIIQGR